MVVAGMPFEQRLDLVEIGRLRPLLRERDIHIVMNEDEQACLGGEIQDPIQRRILKTRHFAGDFRRHEFLVNRELSDTGEYARKGLQDAADMVRRVHVGRIEARDHRVETRLLLWRRQRLVGHGDPCIGERVVIKRRVGIQVISGRVSPVDPVGPLLLQAGSRRSPLVRYLVPHDLEESRECLSFLNVIGEMKMRIVEFEVRRLRTKRAASNRSALRRVTESAERSSAPVS